MNTVKIDNMIAVMTAFKNGERIEVSELPRSSWFAEDNPAWNWKQFAYRIAKQEPKKVKLVAFIDDFGCLRWIREELFDTRYLPFIRIPSEDKEITLP